VPQSCVVITPLNAALSAGRRNIHVLNLHHGVTVW
jgi:hypothetical protein